MMCHPCLLSAMAEGIVCVTIDPALWEAIIRMMEKEGSSSPDEFVNDALRVYIAAKTSRKKSQQDLKLELESLHLKNEELSEIIRRKDDEITVLLKLWEHCPIEEGEKARMERTPELEEKVARMLKNWYYDAERKDHSGVDRG